MPEPPVSVLKFCVLTPLPRVVSAPVKATAPVLLTTVVLLSVNAAALSLS